MAISVQTVIGDFLSHFNDAGQNVPSNTYALGLLNTTHKVLCADIGLFESAQFTINLVAGQQYYALDDTIARLLAVYYAAAAGVYPMYVEESSEDILDETVPGWRSSVIQAAPPSQYFTDGNMLGLYPTPSTSTSGGYPVLQLFTKAVTTLTYSGNLPSQVYTDNAWVYGMCELHAERKQPDQLERMHKSAVKYKMELLRLTQGRTVRQKPSRGPFVTPLRGR